MCNTFVRHITATKEIHDAPKVFLDSVNDHIITQGFTGGTKKHTNYLSLIKKASYLCQIKKSTLATCQNEDALDNLNIIVCDGRW
jgi:hypothetical protein